MHKFLFLLFFICMGSISNAQYIYPYQDIKLEKPSDYKETEPLALSASTYLLTTPFTANDKSKAGALNFLLNWMAGMKEYDIYIRGVFKELSEETEVTALFIAALVKYSLENKKTSPTPMIVENNACKMVLAYCDNPDNKYRIKKKCRKILKKN